MIKGKILLIAQLIALHSFAQNYSNYKQQGERLDAIVKDHPGLAKKEVIGRSAGGKEILMLILGKGDINNKPAIAIIGGIEGNHLLGTELAIGFAEKLLGSDSLKMKLERTSYYIFPDMSPDATEQYFSRVKYERNGNASATDDDRDGRTDEDPFEDLDGNGKITMMRVASPIGDHRINPDDPRSMIRVDLSKDEKGSHLVFSEGTDNDKDGSFNEDGDGGVWLNKNFTFRHPSFSKGSGEFPFSAPETRVLADKLYQLFNVFCVISFSSNTNLSAPYTYNAASANQRLVAGYHEQDVKINEMVSNVYNKIVKLKEAPKPAAQGGDLLSWAYYHYGRFSYSTPGWFIPKPVADTTKKEKPSATTDSVAAYLRWAYSEKASPTFTPWKMIDHPDFPGQQVEVGGVDPFVLTNPPFNMTGNIIDRHAAFIAAVSDMQPAIEISNVRTVKLGNGITRITATVMNTGAFPTHTKPGEKSNWLKKIKVSINLEKQTLISGKKIVLIDALKSYGSAEITFLVKGTGKLEIQAGSPAAGFKKTIINL